MPTRRDFLGAGAALGASVAIGGCAALAGRARGRFELAMAGYTLNSMTVDEALAFCQVHGFARLCVKDFHLPFDSAPAAIAGFRRKCADHGVSPYGVGPILMTDAEEARRRFDYAAALGVSLVVGIPGRRVGKDVVSDRAMCETCSQLADEYKIRYAIHNHGRNAKTGNPRLYPAVPETAELIGDLSPRMGFCVDWAYTYADGLDCREVVFKYAARIFDGHVRCLSDATNGSSGVNPAGRVFDYDGIFAALRAVGYAGCLGLELANAFPDNVQWIDESRDYFRGLI